MKLKAKKTQSGCKERKGDAFGFFWEVSETSAVKWKVVGGIRWEFEISYHPGVDCHPGGYIPK